MPVLWQVLREQQVELVELVELAELVELEALREQQVEPAEAAREPEGRHRDLLGQTWPGVPFGFLFAQWCSWKLIQCTLQQLS